MPPKSRITREMILDAAYTLAREHGIDAVNARSISQKLGCSTQPVLYYFKRVEDIRREVYTMADAYHSVSLMQPTDDENPMIAIGLNYIRFAAQEKPLFSLLFQSDNFAGQNIADLINAPEILPFLEIFQSEAELTPEQAKIVFKSLMLLVHGCASMLANNTMEYNENEIIPMLEMAFMGMIGAIKMEEMQ
jgi:AcrR family transcriptional regulator